MARFNTTGLEGLIREVTKLGEAGEQVGEEMLMAAAEEVKQQWRISAGMHGLKWTGDMIESIGYPNKPKNVGGVKTIDIYPQGTDRRGTRNAEKAFILHYGSSSIRPTHWVDDADEAAGPLVIDVMEQIFDRFLRSLQGA
ncbi:MAG TPA: hypothetical protein DEF42_09605 [Desulfosporosinus sp.]|nr:hypothetical protein [Desulfosporosinus sp.]